MLEYKEIGTETKFLRERLMHLDIKVSKGIGKSKRESDQLRTITIKLDQCISDLEKLMFSQYCGEDACNFDVFYGPHELPNDLQVNEANKLKCPEWGSTIAAEEYYKKRLKSKTHDEEAKK